MLLIQLPAPLNKYPFLVLNKENNVQLKPSCDKKRRNYIIVYRQKPHPSGAFKKKVILGTGQPRRVNQDNPGICLAGLSFVEGGHCFI